MTVTASVFAARYKLACFYISNHLYETLILTDPGIDLADLKKLQRDGGFFMASLRLVEQLTAFTSVSELETLQRKIEATGTMYFKKSILTAVVKQGGGNGPAPNPNYALPPGMSDGIKEKKIIENLYDKLIVKKLYDSYFSAYMPDEPIEFLDTHVSKQNAEDLVSIFELGVFDSDILRTISDILDFERSDGALAAINTLKANPRYDTYKHFFGLVSKCL